LKKIKLSKVQQDSLYTTISINEGERKIFKVFEVGKEYKVSDFLFKELMQYKTKIDSNDNRVIDLVESGLAYEIKNVSCKPCARRKGKSDKVYWFNSFIEV
jgi:hypothetical protein